MALAISPRLLGKTKAAQALLKASSLPLLKFQAYPLLLHRRYQAAVLSYFRQNGQEPDIFCTSDEVIPLLTWSRCALGAAVVPEQAARLLGSSSLIVKKIAQPVLTTSSALIWRKDEVLPAAADHFIQLFRDRDQA
jgi:DNA-binding transcriptional LysR family regulator